MITAEECLIEAENYAAAAMMVGGEEGRALLRLAAIWRNRALRARLESRRNDQGDQEISRH
jgi:hypothetical protein